MAVAEHEGPETRSRPRTIWQVFGPGLVTGASDDDPSGIATYSQAGARFGFDTCWSMLFSLPLACAIQEISARIGRVTGRGIAGNLAKSFPRPLLLGIVALLLVANTINLGADLGAMAAALRLVIGGPQLAYVAAFAVVSVLLEVFVRYTNYARVLKWLTISLFAYVGVALIVPIDWGEVGLRLVAPHVLTTSEYITMVVAILGTTISPYLFFWQAGQEVEEVRADAGAEPLKQEPPPEAAADAHVEFRRIRLDTYLGMAFSNLVALFIIVTCAATLHAHGVTEIQTSAQAAEALRPIAGPLAFAVFAMGIIGAGLLAVPVLAGSAAYALSEAFAWRTGLNERARRAPQFYGAIALATLVGGALNFTPIDPIRALFWSAVINGVVAAPVMAMMMLIASSPRIMGDFPLPRSLKAVGWIATVAMGAAALAMLAAWLAAPS
jgi:NRAMP (natural resistance-associated macrophage protein)-like metal ion transporter